MANDKGMKDVEKQPEKTEKDKDSNTKQKNGTAEKEKDMTEEDKQLQEELDMLVERLQEDDPKLYKPTLESLRSQIRSSTTSMTSVPKPLKFLRPHFPAMKECYETKKMDVPTKRLCADVISVLGMTMSDSRDCLNFRLKGAQEDIGSWGHEYVRHLQAEITAEWQELDEESASRKEDLLKVAFEIVPYHMNHNAEAEACDLLMEIERLDLLEQYMDESSYPRVCLYLHSCVPYVPDPENLTLLRTAIQIYRKFKRVTDAMRLALQLGDLDLIKEIFMDEKIDPTLRKQLAFMLGKQQLYLELPEEMDGVEELNEILNNSHLNNNFLALARELDIMEPKVPEDIYKSHLEPASRTLGGNVDSAKQNLASSFVNGFVNAGFGQDKLLMEDGNKWLYKNKDHGMMSATASLGLVLLWDVDGGLTQIDKYLYSSEDNIKAGALLACGIVNSGVKNECDPALALLNDYVTHNSDIMRIGSIVGLGLAYAGSNREDVIQLLMQALVDSKANMEVVGMAGLAAGLVGIGTCNDEVTTTILQCLLEKSPVALKSPFTRFLVLGLALCYLGKQEAAETMLAAVEAVPEPARSMANILIDICAYAGTGNVLKIQQLLHICSEHYEEDRSDGDKKDDKKDDSKDKKESDKETSPSQGKVAHQGLAVLGIALIAMGEDIGSEMAFRAIGHLLRYGEPVIRRSVPLALALLSTSNPKLNILDTLSKFSHDSDPEVSANSILSMGIVGAGTNNARLSAMLRQLAAYHAKEAGSLFMVRLAQGLVHLGKGTHTLCPFHQDRQLMSPTAVGGLLAVLLSGLDVKTILLGKSHYMLYYLVPAIQPRMLVTFDEELNPLPVAVRVGQAVDVVGQAGKPKTITGFQTHTTPVLLAYGERAELATEEYLAVTPVLEGFVILKKNPDYDPGQ